MLTVVPGQLSHGLHEAVGEEGQVVEVVLRPVNLHGDVNQRCVTAPVVDEPAGTVARRWRLTATEQAHESRNRLVSPVSKIPVRQERAQMKHAAKDSPWQSAAAKSTASISSLGKIT